MARAESFGRSGNGPPLRGNSHLFLGGDNGAITDSSERSSRDAGPGRPAVRPLRLRAARTGLFIVAGGAGFAIMDYEHIVLRTRGEGDRYCGFYLSAFEVWIEPIFGRGLYHLKIINGLFPAPQPNEAGALAASKGLDPGGCPSEFIGSKNGCDGLRIDGPAGNPPVRQSPFLALRSCPRAVLAVVKPTACYAKQRGHS